MWHTVFLVRCKKGINYVGIPKKLFSFLPPFSVLQRRVTVFVAVYDKCWRSYLVQI